MREGDIVFVRGRDTWHKLVSLVGGVSHVAIVYRDDSGELRVSSMSRRKNMCCMDSVDDFRKKWDFFLVVRPRKIDRKVVNRHATKEWNYAWVKQSSTHTYCTRHVIEILNKCEGHNHPMLLHPHSLFKRLNGKVVQQEGKRRDEWNSMFVTVLVVGISVQLVSKMTKREKQC